MRRAWGATVQGTKQLIRQNLGGPEDVFHSLVGDEIRDRVNPSQKHYSKPSIVGAATSVVKEYAQKRYVEPARERGVNMPDVHDDGQAKKLMAANGEGQNLQDINTRLDLIDKLPDKELKEYGLSLKHDSGNTAYRDEILKKKYD